MANKYLDSAGLSYFWGKIKSYISSQGFLKSYTETDPTVPSWAKASTKPTYTASEVGALSTSVTTLPNPKALTITNYGTTLTYDGSAAKSIEIINVDSVGY